MRSGVGRLVPRGRRGSAVIAIAVLGVGQFVGLQLASSAVVSPAVVGNATTFGAINGPNSTAVPTGTVPGDVLVSTVESSALTTITCPAGWTRAWNGTNGSNVRVETCVGIVGATVPNTVHIGVNPPTEVSIVTQAFSGVNTSHPIDASGEAASLTPPSIKASAGDLLVFGEGSAVRGGSAAAPSGAKLGATVYAGTSQAAQATETFPGGGSTPTASWTLNSKSPAVSGVVALLGSSTSNGPQSKSQTITYTSTPPTHPTVGGTYTVTAKGGASGQPVVFSIAGTSSLWACSVLGATVSLLGAGSCVIDANQAGTSSYLAAPQVQQSFTIQVSTTPPSPPAPVAGGNCTAPVYSTSEASGTYNVDGGSEFWWVNNDAWSGSHGPQTIDACNQSSWYAVSNQPNEGGQVETYPDTEYDVGGRNNPSTTTISGWHSITSTFSENYPSTGGWDAAYDLWTDNWTNETMIWNQWAGDNAYWAECANNEISGGCGTEPGVAVTLDGVPYHFLANGPTNARGDPIPCTTANESQCEYMFFRDTQVSSGSVDLLAAWQWEVANGYAKASDVPTQLEYGVEISYTSGTETFPMTGLTLSLS
jgi:hypothetical protein